MEPIFIGRYRVLEEVGRGGMGIVYKAEDPSLERLVAIKILPPKLLRNKEALKRFLREARVAAKLDHPNIIPIYDIGEDGEIYYMVMEYLEGETLREWLENRKTINLEKAFYLFKQMAQAVDYAHRQKVIHRDIKPENIMVLANNQIKVMDFGIAVMEDRHSVTQAGAVLGTIAYLSPEQAQGKPADVRSDIYSLGIVLFESLTGRLPFQAKTPSEMLTQHLSAPPPPASQFNTNIPVKLDKIIFKTLAKDPEERYQSAAGLLEDLNQALRPGKATEEFLGSLAPKSGFQSTGGLFPPHSIPERSHTEEDKTKIAEELQRLLSQNIEESKPKEKRPADLSHDSFAKYRPIVDRIQKDMEALRENFQLSDQDQVDLEPEQKKFQVPCSRCGAPNDPVQKYCRECGSLLVSFTISPHPEAANQGIALYQNEEYDKALKIFQEILQKEPRSAENYLYVSFCLLKTGRFLEAFAAFRKTVELEPGNADAWEGLGDAAIELSRDREALQAYQSAAGLSPAVSRWRKLAILQENLGQIEEACRSLRKGLDLDPKDKNLNRKMIQLLIKLSRYDEALDRVQLMLEQDPRDLQALGLLGQIYEETNRYTQALKAYEKALSVNPEDSGTRLRLGGLLEKQNKPDQAIAHFARALEKEPANPDAHVKLAKLYLKENQDESALSHLKKASTLKPNSPEIHKELGKLYMKKESLDEATIQLEWTIALDPTDPEAHSRLGQIYHKKNQSDLSIREYRTAIQFDPYNPEFHENLGMVYYGEEDIDDAIEEMRKAVSLDPENVDYRKALGVMYETKGKPDLARKEYQKVTEISPNDPLAQGLLGRVYFEQNLVNLAIYQYQKSLELDPGSYFIRGLLGKAYLKIGKYEDAVKTFKEAFKIDSKTNHPRSRQFQGKNYFYLGQALLGRGDAAEAASVLQEATRLLPTFAEGFHLLGKAKRILGDKKEAYQFLLHASRLASGEEGEVFAELAEVMEEAGDREGATQALEKAIQASPEEARYHSSLGDLYLRKGEMDAALLSYQQALKWEKNKKDFYHWKSANVLLEKKNYGEAVEQYKIACQLAPDNWRYHRDLARVYEILGKIQEALQELEKAKIKGPDPDALTFIQEEIKRLKS